MSWLLRYERWLAEHRPDYLASLQPGLSDFTAWESELERTLPASFKALYSWRNGSTSVGEGFLGGRFLSMQGSLEEWRKHSGKARAREGLYRVEGWWSPAWVPFVGGLGGDLGCLDLAGSFGGKAGQVVEFLPTEPKRRILLDTLEQWLEFQVRGFEEGVFEIVEGGVVCPGYELLMLDIQPDGGREIPLAPA